MARHSVEVFADYFQFYVWDGGANPKPPDEYAEQDLKNMAVTATNVFVVNPVRNMDVPVEVHIHEADPGYAAADWDHIVEGHLDLPTGHLQVCQVMGDTALDTRIARGSYHLRALYRGLDSLSEDGLDGEDVYRVVLWPGPARPLSVVKQWKDGRRT